MGGLASSPLTVLVVGQVQPASSQSAKPGADGHDPTRPRGGSIGTPLPRSGWSRLDPFLDRSAISA
jgi:hypothetical protein